MIKRVVMITFLCLTISACGTVRLHQGEVSSSADRVVLEVKSARATAQVVAIDGMEVSGRRFEMRGGRHQLDLNVRLRRTFSAGGSRSSSWVRVPCTAIFDANPGETYYVRGVARKMQDQLMSSQYWLGVSIAHSATPDSNLAEHYCHW